MTKLEILSRFHYHFIPRTGEYCTHFTYINSQAEQETITLFIDRKMVNLLEEDQLYKELAIRNTQIIEMLFNQLDLTFIYKGDDDGER